VSREAWLKERLNGIGASEAAAVIGVSPYISNEELWEIKTGRKIPDDIGDKPYVKFGTEAEKHIRALFALENPQYQVGYEEFKIIRSPDYPFIFATLDGWLTDEHSRNGVWECKTTEILRPNQWAEWTDGVPNHYYVQILHQLLATGFDFAVLTARIRYTDRAGAKKSVTQDYHIERQSVTDDLDYLLKEEVKFWELVKADTRPPLMLPQI
jgi:putative phage-type endonuclease